jgi:hypothetical protein
MVAATAAGLRLRCMRILCSAGWFVSLSLVGSRLRCSFLRLSLSWKAQCCLDVEDEIIIIILGNEMSMIVKNLGSLRMQKASYNMSSSDVERDGWT